MKSILGLSAAVLFALALVLAAGVAVAAESATAEKTVPAAGEVKAGLTLDEVMKDPNRKVGFIRKTYRLPDGTERIYQVWVPLTYTADKKWPTILFLHGAGECGTDGEKVLIQGLPKEIKQRGGKFDFIVVMPQCSAFGIPRKEEAGKASDKPRRRGGWQDQEEEVAMGALEATIKDYSCDTDRLYLTGLSMGGYGTWSFAAKYPKKFVAIVPICGGGDPAKAADLAHLPAWVWHGADDKTVPPEQSRKMVEALKAAGAKEVKYTELPGVGHNSWDNAYADDALWKWLLDHRRPAAQK